jgi:hypothetical protein
MSRFNSFGFHPQTGEKVNIAFGYDTVPGFKPGYFVQVFGLDEELILDKGFMDGISKEELKATLDEWKCADDPGHFMTEPKLKRITFQQWTYENDRPALLLVDENNGEEIATITVNIPEYPLKENEILIKNHSENQGMVQVMVNADIVKHNGYSISSGFVAIPVCVLLYDLTKTYNNILLEQ